MMETRVREGLISEAMERKLWRWLKLMDPGIRIVKVDKNAVTRPASSSKSSEPASR